MKTKIFILMSLSILALIILMSVASAVTSSAFTIADVTYPASVAEDAGSFTFTFNLTYTGSSEDINISFDDSTSSIGGISIPTATSMNGTISESRIITGTINNFAGQGGNTINVVINATTGSSTDDETTFSVILNDITPTTDIPEEVTDCDLIGNPGNDLRIRKIDITNDGIETGNSPIKFGDDDAWFPLDDIQIDIEVENNGNDDIDNVQVDWGLWDTQANEWVIELDDEKDFDIKDDDQETLTISFNLEKKLDVDLEDLNDGDHYRFYVIATGESQEISEDVCAYDFENVELVIESDFVVLSNFQFPETVSCGEEVQIIADTWNIGDRDQDDVYVRVYNTELGINQNIDVGDINSFDHEDLNVILDIPEDAKEKIYALNFDVYDEDDDIYETDFDDDPAEFHILLTVGNCKVQANALVSARLESGGMAGEELTVRATVVNTGSDSKTFTINAAGYASWASLGSVEPNQLVLNKGDSRDVLITFNVNDDIEGEQAFNIEVISDGELVLTQPVSVSIEKKSGFGGITGGVIGEGNTYLWIIGALNVLLVVIIIIVAIRVARK